MSFKVEVREGNEVISFGPRYPGQIGKDILAVKVALGIVRAVGDQLEALPGESGEQQDESIPLDSQGWFDCATGLGIDIARASTFDDSMQRALSRYQIENRFLITCYLFEKFAVPSLIASTGSQYATAPVLEEYSQSIAQQLYAIERLFESEFGMLQEATVAVLHGWRPQSILQNIGFNHSDTKYTAEEFVVDIIPQVLFEDYVSGVLGQTPQSMVDKGIVPEVHAFSNSKPKLREYKLKASSAVDWIKVKKSEITNSSNVAEAVLQYGVPYPFGSIDYIPRLGQRSLLYSASMQVMQMSQQLDDVSVIPASERKERMKRFFYPDPFSDPDPFYINEQEIGFFDETEFLLSPEGPLPSEDPEVIARLEDRALQKVLEFYNKPEIWYFLTEDFQFASTYFGQTEAPLTETHSGIFPREIKSEDIQKTSLYNILNTKILNKERTIERLRTSTEDTTIKRQKSGLFGDSVESDQTSSSTSYRSYVLREIANLNLEIDALREEIEQLKNPTPEFKKEFFWPVSTANILEQVPQGELYSWRTLEISGFRPLIQFVEYRTPTLRPDQPYSAFFIVNKEKLDLILTGESLFPEPDQTGTRADIDTNATDATENQACLDQNSEQAMRTYEEYAAHAQKKRREIVRVLRERVEAQERQPSNGSFNVSTFDLPTVGPFDLDAAFTSVLGLNNISNDADYTKYVIRALAEGLDLALEQLPFVDTDLEKIQGLIDKQKQSNGDVSNKVDMLEITLFDLDRRVGILSDDLSKASGILENEGIAFQQGSDFDSDIEARLLKAFVSEITEYADMLNEATGQGVQSFSALDPKKLALKFVFEPSSEATIGPFVGKRIKQIDIGVQGTTAAAKYYDFVARFFGVDILPSGDKPIYVRIFSNKFENQRQKIKKFKNLVRQRTVNYISNIVEITSPYPSSAPDFLLSFFDDKANACADLFGTDAEKNIAIALVGSYTSGLLVSKKEEEELSESLKSWGKKHFVEPAKLWWQKSSQNAKASLEDTFDEDAALRALGKMCTLEDIYEEFIDKIDLLTLLCNYLECVKLPGFALKLPNLHLPPFPKIPIIGWYAALIKFLIDNMKQILIRILCTFVRTIIDKLAFPFCEEQLQEFIAAGSSATPIMNEALVSALTNTGIPRGEEPKAKQFFEDTSKITTGEELCYLLGGKPLDAAGMNMLRRLVDKNELSDSLDTPEAITNFFGVLGGYLPFEFCQQLAQIETPMAMSCKDASDVLMSIRNRLQTEDTTLEDDEIKAAMDLADKNLQEHKKSLESFSGSSIEAMLPPHLQPNSNNMVISQMPQFMTEQLKRAAQGLFEPAKVAYLSNLSSYVPSMQTRGPSTPVAGDSNYNDIDVLRLETALEQLKNYSYKVARATDADKANFGVQRDIEERSLKELSESKNLKIPQSVLRFESTNFTTYYARCLRGVYMIDQIMSTWEWVSKYGSSIEGSLPLLDHYKNKVLGLQASEDDSRLMFGFAEAIMGVSVLPNNGPRNQRVNINSNYSLENLLQFGIWNSENGRFEQQSRKPYEDLDQFSLRYLGLPKEEFQAPPTDEPLRLDAYDPIRGNLSRWHYPLSPEALNGEIPLLAPFWNPNIWNSIGTPEAANQINNAKVYNGQINAAAFGMNDLSLLGDYSPERASEISELIPLSAITLPGQGILQYETDEQGRQERNPNDDVSVVFRVQKLNSEDVGLQSLSFLAQSTAARYYWDDIDIGNEYPLSRASTLKSYFDQSGHWHYSSWVQNFLIDYVIPTAKKVSSTIGEIQEFDVGAGQVQFARIDSPREPDNTTLSNETKKLLSHEYLVGARNYLVRTLIFLKQFIKEKNDFRNKVFDRFSNPATGDDADNSPQYTNLSQALKEEAMRHGAQVPIIYPDDLKVLYQVFEIEKIPIPEENRQPGGRNYHYVHKKYKVTSYDGLTFENQLIETGGESTESSPTPYNEYVEGIKDPFKKAQGLRDPLEAPPGTYALKPIKATRYHKNNGGIRYSIDNGFTVTHKHEDPYGDERGGGRGIQVRPTTGLAREDFFHNYYSAQNLHPPLKTSSPRSDGIDPEQAYQESVEVNHIISLDPGQTTVITAYPPAGTARPHLPRGMSDTIVGRESDSTQRTLRSWYRLISGEVELDEPPKQSIAVMKLAAERVEYLSNAILEIMNGRPNIVTENHLAIIKEVLNVTNKNRSAFFGDINYSSLPDTPTQAYNLLSGNYKGELINMEFNALPYTPSIKMVEMLTKDKSQDRYNIVIDSDTFLYQGFRSQQGNYLTYQDPIAGEQSLHYGRTPGDSRGNGESLLLLDRYNTPSRRIMKFCDPLPVAMVLNNDPMPERGDFSKREAFAKLVRSSLETTLGGDFGDFEGTLKRSVFKLNTKSIFSELVSSLQYASLLMPDYASELDKRISSRPYTIPGTKCIKNRYGFVESSLLAFDKVILGDMTSEIQQELSDPENSPFNRSYNDISPYDKAIRKIAVKGHIRICLIELLLMGGMAYSVWDITPIVSQPSLIEYIHTRIYHELNTSPSLKEHWPEILEQATGIDNKSEALYSVIREEIIKLPGYSRQVFNPGEGHKDFYNWHIYGRTAERAFEPQSEQVRNKFFTPEGVFKRLPVPSDIIIPESEAASPPGLGYTWKIRDYSGRATFSDLSTFNRRVTRASVDQTSRSGGESNGRTYFNAHDHVSEFIFEDYIRIRGDIVNYYTSPAGDLTAIAQGGCPPTRRERELKRLSDMVEEFFQALVSVYYTGGLSNPDLAWTRGSNLGNAATMASRIYNLSYLISNRDKPFNYDARAKFQYYSHSNNQSDTYQQIEDEGRTPVQIRDDNGRYQSWFWDNPRAHSIFKVYKEAGERGHIPELPARVANYPGRNEPGIYVNEVGRQLRVIINQMAADIQELALELGVSLRISPNIWWIADPRPIFIGNDPDDPVAAPSYAHDMPFVADGWENRTGWLPLMSVMNGNREGIDFKSFLFDTTFSFDPDYDRNQERYPNMEENMNLVRQHIMEQIPLEQALREGIVPRQDLARYDNYDPAIQRDAHTITVFNFGPHGRDRDDGYFYKGSYRFVSGNNMGESSFTGVIDDGTNNIEKYQRLVTSYEYTPPDCADSPDFSDAELIAYREDLQSINEPIVISIPEFNSAIEKLKQDPDPNKFNSVISNSGISQGIRLSQIIAGDDVTNEDKLNSNVNPLIRHMWQNTPNIATKAVTERAYAINLSEDYGIEDLRRRTLQHWVRRIGICEESAAVEVGLRAEDRASSEDIERDSEDWTEELNTVLLGFEITLGDALRALDAESIVVNDDPNNPVLDSPEDYQIRSFRDLENWRIDELTLKYKRIGLIPNKNVFAATIPLVSYEEDICNNSIEAGVNFTDPEVMHRMSEKLAEKQEFKYIMDYMFPVRRFMTIVSLHSTSVLGGYNTLPDLFKPTKTSLGLLATLASTPPALRNTLNTLSQAEFANQIRNNFPGDPGDPSCLGVPGLSGEMLEAFWEELKQLVDEFPARLFRGVANTMDPAYKEMRAHFMNCDIKDLNWTGLNAKGAQDGKLVNGLQPNGPPRSKSGLYTPLLLGVGADFVYSFEDFPYKFPSRFGKMLARLGSYIYSGALPFIDPSGFFSIPCKDYNPSWAENEKWDLGAFGRYGHPISPITAIALSTQQLRADLDKRNSNCPDAPIDEDCEDNL